MEQVSIRTSFIGTGSIGTIEYYSLGQVDVTIAEY